MFRSLALVAFAFALPSCSGDDAADAKSGDTGSESSEGGKGALEGMKEKGGELMKQGEEMAGQGADMAEDLVDQLVAKLHEVKDSETAKTVANETSNMVDKLADMKDTLGENMPDLSALGDAAKDLKEKYDSNEEIMNALQPVIDKIQSLAD